MKREPPVTEADPRGRRSTAALRLKHDLGKYVRLGAPEAREPDAEALRARLKADLGATRSSGGRVWSAPEVFSAWSEDARDAFDEDDPDLETLERVMGRVAELLSGIDTLDESRLAELDTLCVEVSRRCRSLAARSGA
jgi:hypothetical protein